MPKSSRKEFGRILQQTSFSSSDTEDNTKWPLYRGSITDLVLLITILEILNKSHEASFSEEIESFVGAFLQCLLAYLTCLTCLTCLPKESVQTGENHKDE